MTLAETTLAFELSQDGQAVFLTRPTVLGGSGSYTFYYELETEAGLAVGYASFDEQIAMQPGANGTYRVSVTVGDQVTGEQAQIRTEWFTLTGYPEATAEPTATPEAQPLRISETKLRAEVDGRSIYVSRPTVLGGSGSYTYSYTCYDAAGANVAYFTSADDRVSVAVPGPGQYIVYVTVSDGARSVNAQTDWLNVQ